MKVRSVASSTALTWVALSSDCMLPRVSTVHAAEPAAALPARSRPLATLVGLDSHSGLAQTMVPTDGENGELTSLMPEKLGAQS